jgi:hypothetical protein
MESDKKSADTKQDIKYTTSRDDLIQANDMIRYIDDDNPAVVICRRPSGNMFILRVKGG